MTNISEICRILSADAGIANVERWAEALHSTDMLPGLDEAAGPESAATLLLAVMAAPLPDQAVDAVNMLQSARQNRRRCGGRGCPVTPPGPPSGPPRGHMF